jgi:hypothetical protein
MATDLGLWVRVTDLVELRGFEPLTPSMRTRCATGLRHSPAAGKAGEPATRLTGPLLARRLASRRARDRGRLEGLEARVGSTISKHRVRRDYPPRSSTPVPRRGPPPNVAVEAEGGSAYRFSLSGEAALHLPAGRRTAGLLAPHLRLPGGEPGCLAGVCTTASAILERPAAQVDDVHHEQRPGHRDAHPEPWSDHRDAGEFHRVEQHQRGQDPPAPVHRSRAAAWPGTPTRRGILPSRERSRGDRPGGDRHRRDRPHRGRPRRRGAQGDDEHPRRVDRPTTGHAAAAAPALQHPRRRLRPLGDQALGRVVPADQRGRECEQPGCGEHGEEHRRRHPQPSRRPRPTPVT